MKRPAPFEPIGFTNKLEATGNYKSDNTTIFEWTGTHWQAMDVDMMVRLATTWVGEHSNGVIKESNGRTAYNTALIQLSLIAEQAKTSAIPVKNGYLSVDHHGVVMKPHDKSLGLRYVLSCEFNPAAATPTIFNKMLSTILPDVEVRNRVQEYIGYTLLPDARFQRAQFWLGKGANGKSALANIIQALHQRTAAVQLDRLEGFYMANMIGASLIYCDEAPSRAINEQAIKSLIAGELVQIDRKYLSPVSTRIMGKWLILSNHFLTVNDQSTGFWRRFDVIPFSVEIPQSEQDSLLAKSIIDKELTGVLNWALEGLVRLLSRGKFDENLPSAIRQAIQSAKVETNSVLAWSQDIGIEFTILSDTSKADVYSAYTAWCRGNGLPQVSSLKFWDRFSSSVGPWVEGRKFTTSGSRIRTCNIRL